MGATVQRDGVSVRETLERTHALRAPLTAVRRARVAAKMTRARLRQAPTILTYHRVGGAGPDPWSLSVTAEHFAEQLSVLRSTGRPVLPLDELVRRALDGSAPQRAVAITFDDGYADNLHVAAPILADHDMPATVFVATGLLGTKLPTWWDGLAALVHAAAPVETEIVVRRQRFRIDLRDRDRARDDLWSILLPLPADARLAVLDELADAVGATAAVSQAAMRTMTPAEVVALDALDHVVVGSHTVHHPSLVRLDHRTRAWELGESKATLEALLDRDVDLFAYPHGHVDLDVAQAVARAGYRLAVSTKGGPVLTSSDPYRLPRVTIDDRAAAPFRRIAACWG